MSPEQAEQAVADVLALAALPAGDLSYLLPDATGLEVEVHLPTGRDYLLLLCPLGDIPPDAIPGAHIGALIANLASARSGVPVMAFDSQRSAMLARSMLWLPGLAPQELPLAIEGFSAHCREIRARFAESAQAVI